MNFCKKIILSSFLTISSIALTAQQTTTTAIILNKLGSTPIANAHIINKNTNVGAKSDTNGAFTISTKKGDTLLISFVGFKTLKIESAKASAIIYLQKETFTLDSYTVLPYKNFKEFKEAFVQLEIKDTVRKMNPSFVLSVNELKSWGPSQDILRGQFTALAAKFNKRIKDKKNYDKLIARDKYKAVLSAKFNPQLIKRITTLKENAIVNDFITYCDFTDAFIELSSDYELVNQIFKCYKEYNIVNKY